MQREYEYDGIGFINNIGKSKYWGVSPHPLRTGSFTVSISDKDSTGNTFYFEGVNPKENVVAHISACMRHFEGNIPSTGSMAVVTKDRTKWLVTFSPRKIKYVGLTTENPTVPEFLKMNVLDNCSDEYGIITNVGSSKYWGVQKSKNGVIAPWVLSFSNKTGSKTYTFDNRTVTEQDAAQVAKALYPYRMKDVKNMPSDVDLVNCKSGNTYKFIPSQSRITLVKTETTQEVTYKQIPTAAYKWSPEQIKLAQSLVEQKLDRTADVSFFNFLRDIIDV